ncbi:MAG TPA: ATP-binding protein [Candidatus Saccharimonadia bacterium]|jgi:signal transduction histidine kinase
MLSRLIERTYKLFIKPKTADAEQRRQEFILNIILTGSFVLSLVALFVVILNLAAERVSYTGESPGMAVVSVALFGGLLAISRGGRFKVSGYTIVALYLMMAFYTLFRWGISLAEGVLLMALVLVLAWILLGTIGGVAATALAMGGLIVLGYLQQEHLVHFDSSWMKTPGNMSDGVTFSLTLWVITIVSWLSNHETERSRRRAQRSEEELRRQRDLLEEKVRERTRELEIAQHEQLMQMSKFAEFGRLTSGIVHELVSPLMAVSANLQQMNNRTASDKLRRALEGTKRMERYILAARKQLQNQAEEAEFSVSHEIESVVDFLAPLAKKQQVKIEFIKLGEPELRGSAIKLHQIMTNLVSNALDAYGTAEVASQKRVVVELVRADSNVMIRVQDWGTGIAAENLDKIFEPFYTTKSSDQGMGLGLSLVKEYVEQGFGGAISVTSDDVNGTVFALRLPIKRAG